MLVTEKLVKLKVSNYLSRGSVLKLNYFKKILGLHGTTSEMS